jgi:hypothetical protein
MLIICLIFQAHDEDKWNEIVYGEQKYFVLGRLEQPEQGNYGFKISKKCK